VVAMPAYEVTEPGTHWFDVLFSADGTAPQRLLTRIAFTIGFQPQVTVRLPQKES